MHVVVSRDHSCSRKRNRLSNVRLCLPWGIVFIRTRSEYFTLRLGAFPVLLFPNLNPVTDRQMFV